MENGIFHGYFLSEIKKMEMRVENEYFPWIVHGYFLSGSKKIGKRGGKHYFPWIFSEWE
jgi:hypothetical protein